jgi:predicted ATP-grasp superfamily ATP-dependent carboligase
LKTSRQVTVHGFSRRKSRPLQLSNLFTSLEYCKEFELSSWLTRLEEIVARQRIDVVMPVSSVGIRALSEHRRALSWAGKLVQLPEPHMFDTATNKASLADFLAVNGFPRPRTVLVTAGAPGPESLSALTFPVLAKPPLSSGGAGIRRFENLKELDLFVADQRGGQDWVVQEFIQGSDLGVNVLCQDGQIIASTVQHAIDPSSVPYAAATGVEFRCDSLAMNVVRRLVEKLGWSGVANIDMRLDVQREIPLVFEINGRYWLSLLGSLHAGVNFPLLACETVLGQSRSNRRAQEVRYFYGAGNAVLSLFGGGRHRVKPSETDLAYFASDLIFFTSILIAKLVKFFRDKLSGVIRPVTPRKATKNGDQPFLN